MKITNQVAVELEIGGTILAPGQSQDFHEATFNRLSVHSESGSVEITTEYSQRSFEAFGKLKVREGESRNEYGMKEVIIFS